MMKMISSMLLSMFLVPTAAFAALPPSASMYEIVARGAHRVMLDETESPALISFDGDLDAITALALARANAGANGEEDELGNGNNDPFSCPGGATESLEILTWSYSIETVADANVETVIGEVSEIALEYAAPLSLECKNEEVKFASIVAMDANIASSESEKEKCAPTVDPANNKCTVVRGRMRLFLSQQENRDEATSVVLQNIQTAFESPDFVEKVGSGLIKITFIPEAGQDNDAPIVGGGDGNTPPESGSGSSGLSSLIFVAAGSAVLVVAVGSVYLWRRRGSEEHIQGMATQFAGDLTSNPSNESGDSRYAPRPTSPLSQMIPGSYRLGDNTSILSSTNNMSPVYELEDDSVVVSESGYTDEAGRTDNDDSTTGTSTAYGSSMLNSKYNPQATPEYLGALPRPGMTVGDMDMEAPSDSDLDTSVETLSPVKMFVIGGEKLLDSHQDVESPASNVDDKELLFENQEEADNPELDIEEDAALEKEISPGQVSDIFTVEGSPDASIPSPSLEDVELEEEP